MYASTILHHMQCNKIKQNLIMQYFMEVFKQKGHKKLAKYHKSCKSFHCQTTFPLTDSKLFDIFHMHVISYLKIPERHLQETIFLPNPLQGCGVFSSIEMTWMISFASASLSTVLKLWWSVWCKNLINLDP